MIKILYKIYVQISIIFLLVAYLFSSFKVINTQNGDIVLHNSSNPITPTEFYVATVKDERENKAAIAWLLPVNYYLNNMLKTFPVDLRGGSFNAIKKYIEYNISKNAAYRPIDIRLKKFTVTETPVANGGAQGAVNLALSFDLETGLDETLQLTTYRGNTTYTRRAGYPQDIEPILRQALQNGLIYLNNWMNKQAGSNILLAKKVLLSFTDYSEKTEGDTIYYNINRPLTWDDFHSKIGNSRFDAEVFPSFGYSEKVVVDKGVINIILSIKVFLPKSANWAKESARDSYGLNHEQRHLDIAKIVSEHFKQKLKTENLPVHNYDGFINVDYLDAFREMNALQKQYDSETAHGSNHWAQEKWDARIDDELKKLGIK